MEKYYSILVDNGNTNAIHLSGNYYFFQPNMEKYCSMLAADFSDKKDYPNWQKQVKEFLNDA